MFKKPLRVNLPSHVVLIILFMLLVANRNFAKEINGNGDNSAKEQKAQDKQNLSDKIKNLDLDSEKKSPSDDLKKLNAKEKKLLALLADIKAEKSLLRQAETDFSLQEGKKNYYTGMKVKAIFKDGESFQGKLMEVTDKYVKIELHYGTTNLNAHNLKKFNYEYLKNLYNGDKAALLNYKLNNIKEELKDLKRQNKKLAKKLNNNLNSHDFSADSIYYDPFKSQNSTPNSTLVVTQPPLIYTGSSCYNPHYTTPYRRYTYPRYTRGYSRSGISIIGSGTSGRYRYVGGINIR